MSNKTGNARIT